MTDRERLELLFSLGATGTLQIGSALAGGIALGLAGALFALAAGIWLGWGWRELASASLSAAAFGAWEGLRFGRGYWMRQVAEASGILGIDPRDHIGGQTVVWLRTAPRTLSRVDLPIYYKYLNEIGALALRGVPFTYRGYRKYFPAADNDEALATFRNKCLFLGYLQETTRGEVAWTETGLDFWTCVLSEQATLEPRYPSPTYRPA